MMEKGDILYVACAFSLFNLLIVFLFLLGVGGPNSRSRLLQLVE